MPKQLTLNEIYASIKKDWDIEELILPYREGGTAEEPIERSSGTIIDWLVNKKKFPPEVAGAGLLSVLMEIKRGKRFQGDGSYGSKGGEFVQYIAHRCNEFNQKHLQSEMFKTIAGARLEILDEAIFEMVRAQMPTGLSWLSPGTWRWLRKRKQAKAVKK